MAFPDVFDPTEPNPNNVVATDVSKITQNFAALGDVLGLPVNPTPITGAAFTISPNGAVAFAQGGATIPVDPAAGSSIANRQYVDSYIQITNNGSGSAFTATYPGITAYQFGHRYTFFPLNNANGNDTVSINGLAAIPLFKTIPGLGNQQTVPGDFLADQVIQAVFDGQNFQMTGFIGVSHGFNVLSAPSANYTVPGGISTIIVEIYGGSGGGGGGGAQGAGGGGAGAKTKAILSVTPGQSIPYVCGVAGAGGAIGADGGDGGNSQFGSLIAFGGFHGFHGSGVAGLGGAGAAPQPTPGFGWIENVGGNNAANAVGATGGGGGANFQPGGSGGNSNTAGTTGFQGYIIVWF